LDTNTDTDMIIVPLQYCATQHVIMRRFGIKKGSFVIAWHMGKAGFRREREREERMPSMFAL